MNEQLVAAEGGDAWSRARAAEDLQVHWVSAKRLLEKAIAGDLDPELCQKFLERVRRLAADVGASEPSLVDPGLTFLVARWVAVEVRFPERGLGEELLAAFAKLDWEGANA
jgi:hypothetical protein